MREPLKKIFSTDLNKSLLATLIRYFPPIEFNEALIDVVNVLMDGLSSCLLYTSPSPRDKRQSRMPSSA